jgi:HNH endonuclease
MIDRQQKQRNNEKAKSFYYRKKAKQDPCRIPGCPNWANQKDLCNTHTNRVRRHGNPLADVPIKHHRASGQGSITTDGYIVHATGRERKLEHRRIMEKKLGRELRPEETVHHKNLIRSDNHPKNLELWSSRHPKGSRVEDLVVYAQEILSLYGPE